MKTTREDRGALRQQAERAQSSIDSPALGCDVTVSVPIGALTLIGLCDDADELARLEAQHTCKLCGSTHTWHKCGGCGGVDIMSSGKYVSADHELARLREGLEKLEAHNAYHMLRTRKGPVVCLSDIRALLNEEG
jgi:hypothetical protein